jgi:iron complex outermembrane receptor protein
MKIINFKLITFGTLITLNLLYANDTILTQSLEDILDIKTELKSQIGSRDKSKNFLDSNSPVDVITLEQIENSGQTKLTDLLKYYVAGFNTTESSVTDGSDHIRSFTLRGMSSDQILVLINGKRVHTSAQFHESTGVISSGTSHVDLNTIPLISIQRVEILRDGAAAQYGSDAISGIINIILKGQNSTNKLTIHTGKRKLGDGEKHQIDTFISIPLKYDGFTNISISANKQLQTQRAGADRRLAIPTVHTHVGIPDSKSISTIINSEIVQDNDKLFYINAMLNYKDSKASAFYRTPSSSRAIYPDGFLPIINVKNTDYRVSTGLSSSSFNSISWDISNTYGYNKFNYNSYDTMNYDLNQTSPTSFDLGSLVFIQNSTNFDIKKKVNKLTIAGGLEYRYENYQIQKGDKSSYVGTGSQGYTGYMPQNVVDATRDSSAIYLDATYKYNKKLNTQLAGRFEDYSDFGSTKNIKFALGYKIIPKLLLRTTASTGFRAPSLAQSHFSHTSSSLVNGTLQQKGIFIPTHEVAQSLGAKPLKAELSQHITIGGVYQFLDNASLMVDYFYTLVDDKILISDKKIKGDQTQDIQNIFDKYRIASAAYLTNGVNTKTQGVDIKLNNNYKFAGGSILETTLWYNYNENKIIHFNEILSDARIIAIEQGQPKSIIKFINHYKDGKLDYGLNISRFSKTYNMLGSTNYKFNPLTTVDLNIKYKLTNNFDIAVGGNNIFNEIPNKWDRSSKGLGYDGIIPYNSNTAVGYSGTYYYIKATMRF